MGNWKERYLFQISFRNRFNIFMFSELLIKILLIVMLQWFLGILVFLGSIFTIMLEAFTIFHRRTHFYSFQYINYFSTIIFLLEIRFYAQKNITKIVDNFRRKLKNMAVNGVPFKIFVPTKLWTGLLSLLILKKFHLVLNFLFIF